MTRELFTPGRTGWTRTWLVLCWMSVNLALSAQTPVTFRLDLAELEGQELFSSLRGDRVFVRGDFNGWTGTECELTPRKGSGLYEGTFLLDAATGDSVAYKFVIARAGEHYYWEVDPDPLNPPDGNRILVMTDTALELPVTTFVHDAYFQFPVLFSREKLTADFDTMRAMLERIHPALYDYTPREELDAAFDQARDQIRDSMDFRDYFTRLSAVMALIGCGHSHLWIPGDFWSSAPERLFPLKLTAGPEGVLVKDDLSGQGVVPVGSRLVAVNGLPVEEIMAGLEAVTAADGFNPSYKRYMVARQFSKKYAMTYGFPETFRVEAMVPGSDATREFALAGVAAAVVDRSNQSRNELSFKTLDGNRTALLTINTFGYYDRVEMFHAFIDSVFREISLQGTKHLILDLRGNAGGDPFCAAYLLAYLEHEPVPYFDKHYGRYDTLALPLPQPANHFTGKLFTLVDGGGFSTTGHFCALLKYHGIGTFIGEETGATFTCTGSVIYPTLKQTRIILGTARNQRYTAAVKGMDPHRGIIPDYPVAPSPEDLRRGRDAVFEFALSLADD